MTPAAEQVLRVLVRQLAGARSAEARNLAGMASAVLAAEGLPPESLAAVPVRSSGAQRQARYRERHAERHSNASRDGVTLGGEGGGSLKISGEKEIQDPQGGGVGEEVTRHVTRNGDAARDALPVAPPSSRRLNATDDGCFGDCVSAWCEGIQLEIGQPYARPAAGAVSTLVGALNAHRPAEGDAVAWARDVAREYVRANRGITLSPFSFTNWLNSGRPVRDERPSGTRPRALPADHNPNPVQRAAKINPDEVRMHVERALAKDAAKAAGGAS